MSPLPGVPLKPVQHQDVRPPNHVLTKATFHLKTNNKIVQSSQFSEQHTNATKVQVSDPKGDQPQTSSIEPLIKANRPLEYGAQVAS